MNIQERYDDISKISGLSESILRQVFKATRVSLINSLKQGERATLPGICTITPSIRQKIEVGANMTSFIKLKATPSSALSSELEKLNGFDNTDEDAETTAKLNLFNPELPSYDDVRTSQINALL